MLVGAGDKNFRKMRILRTGLLRVWSKSGLVTREASWSDKADVLDGGAPGRTRRASRTCRTGKTGRTRDGVALGCRLRYIDDCESMRRVVDDKRRFGKEMVLCVQLEIVSDSVSFLRVRKWRIEESSVYIWQLCVASSYYRWLDVHSDMGCRQVPG